ncbi:hypothetical protein H257_08061 [Aphanomyces astaci]|uniref:Peptidase A1 domain-containing protein n=1 Tax=Aphanomyces astaci TaxID=112090 RepID=W4GFX9_APHAT|nr:hypothetical protein H257_08061 [Aphanomyces astaci]ETV78555.1 hypothetical protein H257_08061 [Aphanomyces astaci]|eukprot:XP_009832136.1 hypothetical protein H257_08061 [Aphanomyces astaci]
MLTSMWSIAAAIVMTVSVVIECATATDTLFRLPLRPSARRRLEGSPYNEQRLNGTFSSHSAELYLGVPPQKATVVIDTGSAITAVACSTCKNCGAHNRPAYDPAKSTTARPLACRDSSICTSCSSQQCLVSQTYADSSSFDAYLVAETALLGNFNGSLSSAYVQANGVTMSVGCQTSVSGGFAYHPENGILGMQQDPSTLLAAMVRQGRVSRNAFSLCLAPLGTGTIVLGGVDDYLHNDVMQYVPLVRPPSSKYFSVDVVDVIVGATSLGLDSTAYVGFGGTQSSGQSFIVDSGSTISQLPVPVFDKLMQVLQEATGIASFGMGTNVVVPPLVMAKLPTLRLVLSGGTKGTGTVQLVVLPEQYVMTVPDSSSSSTTTQQVVGFRRGTATIGGVLGANVMMHHNILFDLEMQRIGIAPATCTKTRETIADLVQLATSIANTSTPPPLAPTSRGVHHNPHHVVAMVVLVVVLVSHYSS